MKFDLPAFIGFLALSTGSIDIFVRRTTGDRSELRIPWFTGSIRLNVSVAADNSTLTGTTALHPSSSGVLCVFDVNGLSIRFYFQN